MKEIGETLKEAREGIGVSIEEVAGDLKVRPNQIENIEVGNMKAFKDVLYVKGLVKEYSKYLGLNYDDMIDEFNEYMFEYTSKISLADIQKAKTKLEKKKNKGKRIISPYTLERKKKSNALTITMIISVLVLLVVLIFLVKDLVQSQKETEANGNPVASSSL